MRTDLGNDPDGDLDGYDGYSGPPLTCPRHSGPCNCPEPTTEGGDDV